MRCFIELYFKCINRESSASIEKKTKGSTISGLVRNRDGTPAHGARVKIVPANFIPIPGLSKQSAATDTTIVDASGKFQSAPLPIGKYNLFIFGQEDAAFEDSIQVNDDSTSVVDVSLGPPGSISGYVRLQPGDDPRTVLILGLGTNSFFNPDSTGRFVIWKMPAGKYSFRFLTTLDDYRPLDTTLEIVSSTFDTLHGSINLSFSGIPFVDSLDSFRDTLRQITILSWSRADAKIVNGYNIYRKDSTSGFSKLNNGIIKDSIFRDTMTIQDQNYEYRIKCVDNKGNEGAFSAPEKSVAVGIFERIDSIKISVKNILAFNERDHLLSWNNLGTPSSTYQLTITDLSSRVVGEFEWEDSGGNHFLGLNNGIALDRSSNVWVKIGSQIKIYSPQGSLLDSILGAPDASLLKLISLPAKTYGIFLHNSAVEIYIIENTKRFNLVSNIGQDGYCDSFIKGDDSLIVLDGANRISILDTSGALIGTKILSRDVNSDAVIEAHKIVALTQSTYLMSQIKSETESDRRVFKILDANFNQIGDFGRGLDWDWDESFFVDSLGRLFVFDPKKSGDLKCYKLR